MRHTQAGGLAGCKTGASIDKDIGRKTDMLREQVLLRAQRHATDGIVRGVASGCLHVSARLHGSTVPSGKREATDRERDTHSQPHRHPQLCLAQPTTDHGVSRVLHTLASVAPPTAFSFNERNHHTTHTPTAALTAGRAEAPGHAGLRVARALGLVGVVRAHLRHTDRATACAGLSVGASR